MKKILFIFIGLCALLIFFGCSKEQNFSCYNVNLGSDRQTVMSELEKSNFKLISDGLQGYSNNVIDEVNRFVMVYSGDFFGLECTFYYMFDDKQVWALSIYPEDESKHSDEGYKYYLKVLTDEYGEPELFEGVDDFDTGFDFQKAVWDNSNLELYYSKDWPLLMVLFTE